MSKEHPDMNKVQSRSQRLANSAVLSRGEQTFIAHRHFLMHDDEPSIEMWVIDTPPHEGELLVYRLGQRNDGPFGVEFYSAHEEPVPTDRARWWAQAIHAAACFAENLNRRQEVANAKP